MERNEEKFFCILNIIIPILVGAVVYYILSPEVIFVRQIDALIGRDFRFTEIVEKGWFLRLVRNYLLDVLWGYALLVALYFMFGSNTAELLKILIIAFVFSAVMELLQLTSIAKGTFDVFDIIVEFFAEMVAVFIIKKYKTLRRKGTNEKKI